MFEKEEKLEDLAIRMARSFAHRNHLNRGDCESEALLALMKTRRAIPHLDELPDKLAFRLVVGYVRVALRRYARKERRALVIVDEAQIGDSVVAVAVGTDAEPVVDLEEIPEEVRDIVRKLLEGYKIREIAGELGISPQALYLRLHKASERERR